MTAPAGFGQPTADQLREKIAAARAAGYSDAEIKDYLVQRGLVEPPTATAPAPVEPNPRFAARDPLTKLGQAAGRGLTLGWSEKAIAALRAVQDEGPFAENYVREYQQRKAETNQFREAHPVLNTAAEIGGSLLPAAALAIPSAGASAAAPLTLGSQVLRGAGVSALTGAVGGAGNADPGQEMSGAIGGAVFGVALGGAAPVAVRGAEKAIGALRRAPNLVANERGAVPIGPIRPKSSAPAPSTLDRADEAILRAMHKGGQTPAQLKQLAEQGTLQPGDMVADLLEAPGQRLIRGARTASPKASGALDAALNARQRGQFGEVMGAAEQALGVPQQNVVQLADDLVQQMKAKAAPAYRAAYEAMPSVMDPDILAALDRPQMQRAYQFAQGLAESDAARAVLRGEGAVAGLPPLEDVLAGKAPISLQTLHYIKLALDEAVKDPAILGTGGTRATSNAAASQLAAALRDKLHAISPQYADAARQFAGDVALKDALELGQTFFAKSNSADALAKQVAGLQTQGEAELFRVGILDALRNKTGDMGDLHNKVRVLWENPNIREKLQTVIPAQNAQQFEALIRAKGNQFATRAFLQGNSQTADKLVDAATAMGLDPEAIGEAGKTLSQATTGNIWAPFMYAGKKYNELRFRNLGPAIAERALIGRNGPQDVAQYADVLQQLADYLVQQQRRGSAGAFVAGGVGGGRAMR